MLKWIHLTLLVLYVFILGYAFHELPDMVYRTVFALSAIVIVFVHNEIIMIAQASVTNGRPME